MTALFLLMTALVRLLLWSYVPQHPGFLAWMPLLYYLNVQIYVPNYVKIYVPNLYADLCIMNLPTYHVANLPMFFGDDKLYYVEIG